MCKKFVGDVRRKAPSNHNASLTLTEGEKDRGVSKKKKKKKIQTVETKFQESFG